VLGNVLTRADANESLTETFTYDNLNRVTSATVSQSVAPVKNFTYDALGVSGALPPPSERRRRWA